MQLYHSPASPFVRKVMVTLHETGLLDSVEIVPAEATATNTGPSPAPGNPLGKIPTLVRPDGPALFDSRVICRYLNARGHASFYPESRLWEVLTLEALADGITEAAVLMVYEARFRPEGARSQAWLDGQWSKINRGLDAVEAQWMSHLAGPLHMGQIALGCSLGYLDFRHGDRDWRAGRAALAEWEAQFRIRASMEATVPA